MVCLAAIALTVFHPGFSFRQLAKVSFPVSTVISVVSAGSDDETGLFTSIIVARKAGGRR